MVCKVSSRKLRGRLLAEVLQSFLQLGSPLLISANNDNLLNVHEKLVEY